MNLADSNTFLLVLAIILLIVGLILGWLAGRGRSSEEGEKPAPPPTPSPKPVFFAPNQLIITGKIEEIRAFQETSQEKYGFTLEEVPYRLIPVAQFPRGREEEAGEKYSPEEDAAVQPEISPETAKQRVAELCGIISLTFQLTANQQNLTLAQINQIVQDNGLIADHNYKVGRPSLTFQGDPESTEGFAVGAGAVAPKSVFYNQWAFHSPNAAGQQSFGIDLFQAPFANTDYNDLDKFQENRVAEAQKCTGEDVVVAMFDTSPFDHTQHLPHVPLDPDMAVFERGISYLHHHIVPGVPDARDHGTLGASLIKAIAPRCNLLLYRVLNDSNQGDLNSLLYALDLFILEMAARPGIEPGKELVNTVVNLSLGVNVENPNNNEMVQSLRLKLECMHKKGAVIVAASGNDSGETPNSPKPPQIPARYEFVLGVGSSNYEGQRSRFSNLGNVYAPGGDNDNNIPINDAATNPNDYVVGYAQRIAPDTKFAYWRGTSFSAPMVSGLAALYLSCHPSATPDKVTDKIIGQAKQPASSLTAVSPNGTEETDGGIINIPQTLAD